MTAPAWWERREVALAAILLSIVPLLWPQVPPLTDLPGHIGRYRVMLGTDADILDAWYRFEWRLVGNLGVDLIVYALAPLVGLEPAVKLAVIGVVALTASGILWLAKEVHGRVTPFAYFALPLAYGYPLQFGFVNYALAMALALNGFALWLWLARHECFALRALLFVPLSCAIWLAHIMGWGVLGLMAFCAEVARHRASRRHWPSALARGAIGCAPLALPFVALLAWRSDSGGGVTGQFFYFKLQWLLAVVRDRWAEFDVFAALLLWGVVGWGLIVRRVERSAMLTGVFALLAATYLALPYVLFDSTYADMRLAPYVLIVGLVALRPGAGMTPRSRRNLALLAVAFLLIRTGGTTLSFVQFDASYRRQLAALDSVPRGARLVTLVGEQCVKTWSASRLGHLPSMALARRAAFANDQWRLNGSALLTVTATGMGPFSTDPSQMVLGEPCAHEPLLKPVDVALAAVPRDTVDYVWLIEPPRFDPRLLAGMTPVWRDGTNGLYRVEKQR